MNNPPWSAKHIQSCVERGPHPSANLHCDFLCDEYVDFIEASFWVVLPLAQVQVLNKDLRISPMAIKVEHNQHLRMIMDHTWFSVNNHTIPDLPREMMQFGGALPCILWLLHHANLSAGPVYLSKYNITDSFYHMFLKADDALHLAITMPSYDDEPPLLAILLSLTMGWTNSLPTFCAVSKTAADVANDCIANDTPLPTHCMEPLASAHDAWAHVTQHGLSAINMLRDPLVPTTGDPLVPAAGTALMVLALGDLLVPTAGTALLVLAPGDPLVPTAGTALMVPALGDPLFPTTGTALTAPTLGDLLVPTSGDPLVSPGVLVLHPCCPAPDVQPPLLLHSGPVTHVNVFVDDFIGLAQGSLSLCQHVC